MDEEEEEEEEEGRREKEELITESMVDCVSSLEMELLSVELV